MFPPPLRIFFREDRFARSCSRAVGLLGCVRLRSLLPQIFGSNPTFSATISLAQQYWSGSSRSTAARCSKLVPVPETWRRVETGRVSKD